MSIQVVFNVMLELFIIMVLGYIFARKKFLDKNTSDKLSWLIVNVSLPMMIIASVFGKEGELSDVTDYLLYGVIFYAASMIIAFLVCKILFVKKQNMGTYQFMLIFSNGSFMGYPVMSAIFGEESIFLMSIFNIPFNIIAFTYGIFLLSKGSGEKGGFDFKKLINPGIIASIVAIVIYACGIRLPDVVESTCSTLGNITTPISMLVLGISLAQVPVKELFNEFRIYPMTLVRLIGLPLLTFFIVSMFTDNTMLIGVTTGTAAMPVASMCVMLTTLYGGNVKLASVGVFITTICSVVTIPVIMTLLFG